MLSIGTHLNIPAKLSEHEKRFVIKMLTKWIPVGHNLNKYSTTKHKCPFCEEDETVYHLFQCSLKPLKNAKFITQLEDHLQQIDTDQFLQAIIIQHFRAGIDTPQNTGEQTPIWYLASAGLIPLEWTQSQTQFMNKGQSSNISTGHTWTHSLAYWLIQKSLLIWKHRLHRPHSNQKISQFHQYATALYSQKYQLLPTTPIHIEAMVPTNLYHNTKMHPTIQDTLTTRSTGYTSLFQ